jgi:hypothetical protein
VNADGTPTTQVGRLRQHPAAPPERRRGGCEFDLVRDDDTWAFRDADGALVTRRLRVWLDGNGGLIAVVTEAGTGTCITDAAAQVHHHLTAVEYPGQRVRVFEHWPADTDEGADEQFDEVLVDGVGEVSWGSIPAGPFTSLLQLPPPEHSRYADGRVSQRLVFSCFDQGSVMITDPHGGPLGMLQFSASDGTEVADSPQRLAAALLASSTDDRVADPELTLQFARTVLAGLPASGWRLGDQQIVGWLIAHTQNRLVA